MQRLLLLLLLLLPLMLRALPNGRVTRATVLGMWQSSSPKSAIGCYALNQTELINLTKLPAEEVPRVMDNNSANFFASGEVDNAVNNYHWLLITLRDTTFVTEAVMDIPDPLQVVTSEFMYSMDSIVPVGDKCRETNIPLYLNEANKYSSMPFIRKGKLKCTAVQCRQVFNHTLRSLLLRRWVKHTSLHFSMLSFENLLLKVDSSISAKELEYSLGDKYVENVWASTTERNCLGSKWKSQWQSTRKSVDYLITSIVDQNGAYWFVVRFKRILFGSYVGMLTNPGANEEFRTSDVLVLASVGDMPVGGDYCNCPNVAAIVSHPQGILGDFEICDRTPKSKGQWQTEARCDKWLKTVILKKPGLQMPTERKRLHFSDFVVLPAVYKSLQLTLSITELTWQSAKSKGATGGGCFPDRTPAKEKKERGNATFINIKSKHKHAANASYHIYNSFATLLKEPVFVNDVQLQRAPGGSDVKDIEVWFSSDEVKFGLASGCNYRSFNLTVMTQQEKEASMHFRMCGRAKSVAVGSYSGVKCNGWIRTLFIRRGASHGAMVIADIKMQVHELAIAVELRRTDFNRAWQSSTATSATCLQSMSPVAKLTAPNVFLTGGQADANHFHWFGLQLRRQLPIGFVVVPINLKLDQAGASEIWTSPAAIDFGSESQACSVLNFGAKFDAVQKDKKRPERKFTLCGRLRKFIGNFYYLPCNTWIKTLVVKIKHAPNLGFINLLLLHGPARPSSLAQVESNATCFVVEYRPALMLANVTYKCPRSNERRWSTFYRIGCCGYSKFTAFTMPISIWTWGNPGGEVLTLKVNTSGNSPKNIRLVRYNESCIELAWNAQPMSDTLVTCPNKTGEDVRSAGVVCCNLKPFTLVSIKVATYRPNFHKNEFNFVVKTQPPPPMNVKSVKGKDGCARLTWTGMRYLEYALTCPPPSWDHVDDLNSGGDCCGLEEAKKYTIVVHAYQGHSLRSHTVVNVTTQLNAPKDFRLMEVAGNCFRIGWKVSRVPGIRYKLRGRLGPGWIITDSELAGCDLRLNETVELAVKATLKGFNDSDYSYVTVPSVLAPPSWIKFVSSSKNCFTISWNAVKVPGIKYRLSCPLQPPVTVTGITGTCCHLPDATKLTASVNSFKGRQRSIAVSINVTTKIFNEEDFKMLVTGRGCARLDWTRGVTADVEYQAACPEGTGWQSVNDSIMCCNLLSNSPAIYIRADRPGVAKQTFDMRWAPKEPGALGLTVVGILTVVAAKIVLIIFCMRTRISWIRTEN